MSILSRNFHTYRFFEIVNRVCLINSISSFSSSTTTNNDRTRDSNDLLISCDFEVFGKVQRVYFRKYTQQQANKLNLVGWVKNTNMSTVQGHMEGLKNNIEQMKIWLEKTGSPMSEINKTEFTNEKIIKELSVETFEIKR